MRTETTLLPRHAPTLTVEQVAALFHYNAEHFRAHVLPKLQREGFPAKLPGVPRWSRRAVMAWIDHQVGPQETGSDLPVTIMNAAAQ